MISVSEVRISSFSACLDRRTHTRSHEFPEHPNQGFTQKAGMNDTPRNMLGSLGGGGMYYVIIQQFAGYQLLTVKLNLQRCLGGGPGRSSEDNVGGG